MDGVHAHTYRNKFQSAEIARVYDEVLYSQNSYESLIWEIERRMLLGIVKEFRRTHQRIDYLDFATGTGRVLSFLEDEVDNAIGIEISEQMAQRARAKVKRAPIVCCDLTVDDPNPNLKYDLITAFRFIANAEQDLRYIAIRSLVQKLRDQSSIIVFNNHRNPLSYKGLLWPASRMRALHLGYRSAGNYLTGNEIRVMLDSVGLTVRKVYGYGTLSGKITSLVTFARPVKWERWLSDSKLAMFGVCQLYVCTKR